MPYIHTWEENGVYRKYSDKVTGQEVINALTEVHGHALFDSIRYVINDMLEVSGHEVSYSDVKTIAAFDRAAALTNPGIKVAIVATMPTIQDMAEKYGELINNSPYLCEVFTSLEEARAWIS